MNPTDLVDQTSLRSDIPDFAPGDTLKVHVRVVEGQKERVQVFQGVVIGRSGSGIRETFKVRKVSYGVGVLELDPGPAPGVADRLPHLVGQVEAPLGLHDVREHRADVLVLLVQLELDVGLVPLEILGAHGRHPTAVTPGQALLPARPDREGREGEGKARQLTPRRLAGRGGGPP